MKFPRLKNSQPSKIRQIYAHAGPDFIDLGLGMPYCTTPDFVKSAARKAIDENQTFYTLNQGNFMLREAVAGKFTEEQGVDLTAGNVIINTGVAEAVFQTIFAIIRDGDDVLVPDPGYPAYPAIVAMAGGRPVGYPLKIENRFGLVAGDIISRITPKTRLIVLNSPANPTGGIHSSEELEKLAGFLDGREITVLSDEVYSRLYYAEGQVSSISRYLPLEKMIVVSGVSKEFGMTGWRIGWTITGDENIRYLLQAHLFMVSCASSVSQAAALAAVRTGSSAVLKAMQSNRGLMLEGLQRIPDLRFHVPEGGIYFFVDVSRYGSGDAIADRILSEENVVTIPGSGFGPNGSDCLRLSFGAEPGAIREGLNRLARFFAGQSRKG